VITGLQKLGFPIEITEAVANHRSGTLSGVAKVYHLHDHFEGKQRALAAWADRVIAIGSGEPVKSNVVPMVPR
jgi:hypothetical protein